ncbi:MULTISPECIES: hypothetical protein [Devosia]|uniref:hypothetical protein n=1 Tax=Devosia TaxID=46913 RepID=UPI001300B184|nr:MULTISPECIES: hypothetical protein [Devosia]
MFAMKYTASVLGLAAVIVTASAAIIATIEPMPPECKNRAGGFNEMFAPTATEECRAARD